MITIRRLQPGEADLFRQVRLQALQEAPYAFPTTYQAALQRSPESWHAQAERSAQGADRATFIAFSDDDPIGMAALYRDKENFDVGELLQVWVSPGYRGSKVIWDLMDEVFKWGSENKFRRIIAGVTRGNTRALQFYLNYGFSIFEEVSSGEESGTYLEKVVK